MLTCQGFHVHKSLRWPGNETLNNSSELPQSKYRHTQTHTHTDANECNIEYQKTLQISQIL